MRLKAPCSFGQNAFECTIDTQGSVSVASEGPAFASYPVLSERKIVGIGISMTCHELSVSDFNFLEDEAPSFKPAAQISKLNLLRCPMQNDDFPLIGLPFFEGKKFTFDFANAKFDWTVNGELSAPLVRIGGKAKWIGYGVELGGEQALLSFDTGNPVTMIRKALVDRHPELFKLSPKEMNPGLKAKGLIPYEALAPIVVNGVALEAAYIYAIESLPFPEAEQLQIILGLNHMAKANWKFDLEKGVFGLSKGR